MRLILIWLGLSLGLGLAAIHGPAVASECIDYRDYIHRVGYMDLPDHAWGLEITGTLAWIAAGRSGLVAADITNPASPVIVGM